MTFTWSRHMIERLAIAAVALTLACDASPRPASDTASRTSHASTDRLPAPYSTSALMEERVPKAIAGQSGWKHAQRVRADFDADGKDETLVVISDAELDRRGQPIYSDGHRWQ